MSGFVSSNSTQRAWPVRICVLIAVVFQLASANSICYSEEKATNKATQKFNYRRLFVPAGTPEKWPVGSERYVPISNTEFSQLIEHATSSRQHPVTEVRITDIVSSANLTQDHILAGSAEIGVHLTGNNPRVLPLTPLNLVVTAASWKRDTSLSADLALWQNQAEKKSELGIYVEQPDTLQLEWQLQATKIGEDLEYLLKLPISTLHKFSLTLPPDQTPSIASAELISTDDLPTNKKIWVYQLGPSGTHRLRITQSKLPSMATPLPRVSQVSEYRIDPQGLSLTSGFQVNARSKANTAEMRFSLSGGLKVLSVLIEQKEVPWQVAETATGKTMTVSFLATAKPQLIEIQSLSRLSFNEPWQLPAIHLLNADWTEGTSTLQVAPSLEVLSLAPQLASLEQVIGIDAAQAEETYRIQEWTEDATIELTVRKRATKVHARTATIVNLDPADIEDTDIRNLFETNPNDTTARTVSILTCQGRPAFQFEGEVSPNWSIEAIKTRPSKALREWHVYQSGDQNDDRKLFRIQLAQPLEPGQQLRIECDSRATRDDSILPATANELIPVRFPAIKQTKQMLLLRSQKRGQLELPPRLDNARLQFETLSAEDAALLPEAADGALLDLSQISKQEPLRLLPRRIQYRADVNVEVSALPDALVHKYQIDCTPNSGIVTELVVGFDEPLPDSTQWEVEGQSNAIVAQRLDQVMGRPSGHDQGIHYLIRLPVAIDEPFQLQASYTAPAADTQKCNLIHLPNAIDWQGELVIRGPLAGLKLNDRGWTPTAVLTDKTSAISKPPVIGSYRLGPNRAGSETLASTLEITREKDLSGSPNIAVWLADIQLSLSEEGTAIYVATYHFENSGASGIEFELPLEAKLQDAWLNQQQLDSREVISNDRLCRIHFSDQQHFATIALQYVLQGKPLGHSTDFRPSLPRCPYPIESSRWTVWTPEHFNVESPTNKLATGQLNWSTRLLGPLARARGEGAFNPLQAEDWRRLWTGRVNRPHASPSAERISQALSEMFVASDNPHWGYVLHAIDIDSTNAEKIYIDRLAFESLGIRADSQLSDITESTDTSDQQSSSSTPKTLSPLERCGLSLVTTPNLTLLTSQQRTSQWRDQLRPAMTPNVYRVISKSLVARLESVGRGQSVPGAGTNGEVEIVDINTWLAIPKLAESPWKAPVASSVADIGRRAATLEFTKTPPMIVVQREYGQRAEWYAIWLLTLVLSCRQLSRYPRYLALAIAISAAACLVAPSSWLTLPQAVFLGLLASVVWQIFLPRTALRSPQISTYRLATRMIIFVVFLGSSLLTGLAIAETTEETTEETTNSTAPSITKAAPRIFIPVDSEGVTQGDDIYLPEDFLHTLLQNQGSADHDNAQCVIRSIAFQGTIPATSLPAKPDAANWILLLDVESFVSNTQLKLPFRRDEAEWNSTAPRLNGSSVELHWEADGRGCSVDLVTAGSYRLEISVRPKVSLTVNEAQIRLHIPVLSGTKLSLRSPNGFQNLSIPTAGHFDIDQAKTHLQTTLSASEVLEVSWLTSPEPNTEAQSLGNVENLSWLHVEPTSARLDVQLNLRLRSTKTHKFLLATSQDLILLPLPENSPIESAQYLPDQRNTLEVVLKQNVGESLVVPLQFKLQRTVSVGRINYPWVQIPGFTQERSLLAVSVSDGLSYDENLRSEVLSILPEDFLQQWKDQQETPLYAYALSRGDLAGSLRIWPDPKTLAAQQSMKIHCQLERTLVTYEAAINELGGRWLTYRLQVPENLQISGISVQQQSELTALPIRWHRVSDSQVVVLLSQPLKDPHLLTLQGYIHTHVGVAFSVPNISLVDANSSEMRMDLYRDSDALVGWVDLKRLPKEIQQQNIPRGSSVNLVGKYIWNNRSRVNLSDLLVETNRQQFDAHMVTTLAQGPNSWSGTAHAIVKVREGMLSHLGLTVSDNFQGPYLLEPTSLGSVREHLDSSGRRHVVVQLQKPLSKDQKIAFRISGAINLPADQRLTIPDLQVTGASHGDRFVLLPTIIDKKSIQWDQKGLTPKSLPEELGQLIKSQHNTQAFMIEQQQFNARERSYQGTLRNASWRHTLISGVLDHKGNLSATAELIMQPGRATHCTLLLPENTVLKQILTGDSRVRRDITDNHSWRVPLGPPYLPRRITVSYQTTIDSSSGQYELLAPKLLIDNRPLPSPEVRWKIRPVGQLVLEDPVIGRPLSQEQYTRAALQFSLHTLADARLSALELPEREGRAWFKPWQRRTEQAWQQWRIIEPDTETLAELSATAFGSSYLDTDHDNSAWVTLLDQLGESEPNSEQQRTITTYPPNLPGQSDVLQSATKKFFVSDAQGHLVLTSRPTSQGNGWRWCFAVAIVGGAVVLIRRIGSKIDWASRFQQQPHRLLIGLGLIWWLLFTASAVGLLVVFAAMLSLTIRHATRRWRFDRSSHPQVTGQTS